MSQLDEKLAVLHHRSREIRTAIHELPIAGEQVSLSAIGQMRDQMREINSVILDLLQVLAEESR
jgi:hypothetical protein